MRRVLNDIRNRPVFYGGYIAIICICLFFVWGTFSNNVNQMRADRVISINNVDLEQDIRITSEELITQKFQANYSEITELFIWFDTYDRVNEGSIEIQIFDEGNQSIITKKTYDMALIPNKQGLSIPLDKPILKHNRQNFEIQILLSPVDPSQTVSLIVNQEKTLFVNELMEGEKNIDGNLMLIAAGNTYNFEMWTFIGVVAIMFFVITIIYFLKKMKLEMKFLILILSLGAIYCALLPGFTAPDEGKHFTTAYHFSNKIMNTSDALNDKGEVMARAQDTYYSPLSNGANPRAYQYFFDNNDVSSTTNTQSLGLTPLNTQIFSYLPQSLGITAARILDLSAPSLIIFGRLFNLLFYASICFLAIKIIPHGKMILFTISLFPMSIELASSYSYDPIINSLSFLFIALILYYRERQVMKKWDYMILAGIIAIMAPIKVIYFVLSFLCLLIPARRASVKKHYMYLSGVILAGVLAILVTKLSTINSLLWSNTSSNTGAIASYTIGELMMNPVELISIIYNTIFINFSSYINTAIGSHLGWMNVDIPLYLIYGFLVVLLLSALKKDDEKLWLGHYEKIICLVVAIVTSGLVVVGMLLDYTPSGLGYAYGVQGRYFIPIICLLILGINNNQIVLKKDINQGLIVSLGILQFLSVLAIISTTFG